MLSEIRLPCAGLLALLLATPGCATDRAAGAEPGYGDARAPAVHELTADEQADLDCARLVQEEKRRICDDAPPSLPEGYGERSRATVEGLDERCGSGMRARAALRELDACLLPIEEDPSQIDLATNARREGAGPLVTALKEDPLFPRARRRLQETREEAELAAGAYRQSLRDGESESKVRFRADAWEQAESDYRTARRKLLEMMERHGVDPRDARALGVW
jgi:hypothetical protein